MRAVFVHVISDLIGSFGVLASGALNYFTGWLQADPAVSLLIGVLGALRLVGPGTRGRGHPDGIGAAHIDLDELRTDLLAVTAPKKFTTFTYGA